MKIGKIYILAIGTASDHTFRKGMKFLGEENNFFVFRNTILGKIEEIPKDKLFRVEEDGGSYGN